MRHASLIGTILIVTTLGAASCGSDGPGPDTALGVQVETPSAMAELVPQDAFLYLQVSSLDEFAARSQELVAAVNPEYAREFDPTGFLFELQLLTGDVNLIARDRPFAVAASLPAGGGMPAPTFIVPTTNADAYVASVASAPGMAPPVTKGDYVGVTLGAPVAPSTSSAAITESMSRGFVSARVDLAKVLATFRPVVEMALAQGEQQLASAMAEQGETGLDLQGLQQLYFDGLRAVVDSAKTLDLAVASVDGELELGWSLTASAGSLLAGFSSDAPVELGDLTAYIDAGSPIAVAFGADVPALMDRMQPFLETLMAVYPEPMREAFPALLEDFEPLFPLFGSAIVADGMMDERGMRFAYFLRPTDADALRDGYVAAIRSEGMQAFGLTPGEIEETEVDGVPVTSLRFDLDTEAIMAGAGAGQEIDEAQLAAFEDMMETVYGEDGMRFHLASQGGVMAMVVGGDDAFLASALERLSSKGTGAPRGLERAITRIAAGNPCFAYHFDLGSMMTGISALMAGMPDVPDEMPDLPPGLSAPMTFYGTIEGRVWRGGALMDVEGLAELVQAMEGS